ncbi:MAG TPA: hypothetical protein VF026_00640 [Ktedonobacteraceae bacterium]
MFKNHCIADRGWSRGSLIVMAVAPVLGLLSSLLVSGRRPTPRQEVANQQVQDSVSAS